MIQEVPYSLTSSIVSNFHTVAVLKSPHTVDSLRHIWQMDDIFIELHPYE